MNERGFTLIEVMVSAVPAFVVLGGITWFFLATTRFHIEADAQTFLQRQAQTVIDDVTRQIQPATGLQITTCGGVANSLQVTNPAGVFCYRRDSSTGTRLLRDLTAGGSTNTADLLSGSLTWSGGEALSTVDGACPDGGFCPSVSACAATDCKTAVVTFRLRYRIPETSSYQVMTFTTSIGRRN